MRALIDGDILRYEVGFAAEVGWKAATERDEPPPFDFVKDLLHQRIQYIMTQTNADDATIYLTEGPTFRFDIAKTKPYKGNRVENKPWHHVNLTAYMKTMLGLQVVTKIEADDAMAIEHIASDGTTIICSRDKDLKQVPGWFYSWELGRQPSFGPELITKEGSLHLSTDRKKLSGTGLSFFYAQVLMGDRVDNIPGLGGWGPVRVFDYLSDTKDPDELLTLVKDAYNDDEFLLEQGQLCWIVRRTNEDGSPQVWSIGLNE